MRKEEGRMREGAGSRAVCSGRGIRPCLKPGCCLRSAQSWCCGVGVRQPPSPRRSLGALLLRRPSPAKLPVPAMAFAGLRQKCAELLAELGRCHVFYLGTASSPARRRDPCWVDDAPSEKIPPADPLDNLHRGAPWQLPWENPLFSRGFCRGHDTLRSQPGFSRVHNGDSWVTVWGQGDGKWQGQRAGEGRGDERRWAAGSETSGAEPLSSCIIFSQGALGSPLALPGRCCIALWVSEMLL